MSWQILTFISALALSGSVLLQRLLLHQDKSNPVAYVIAFQGLVGILIGIYALFNGFVLPDFSRYWLPSLLTVLLYAVGHVLYAKTLQIIEASTFSVLFATSALWLMLLGVVFFSERLQLSQVIGAMLIFLSIVVVSEISHQRAFRKGIYMGLVTGLIFGLASFGWIYVGKESDAASWTSIGFIAPSLLLLTIRNSAMADVRRFLSGRMLGRLLALGALFSISAVTLLLAYKSGSTSRVAPLQQSSIIITTLMAIWLLHERMKLTQKLVAAAICLVGVLLIL